jgi:hypothetical protein
MFDPRRQCRLDRIIDCCCMQQLLTHKKQLRDAGPYPSGQATCTTPGTCSKKSYQSEPTFDNSSTLADVPKQQHRDTLSEAYQQVADAAWLLSIYFRCPADMLSPESANMYEFAATALVARQTRGSLVVRSPLDLTSGSGSRYCGKFYT